MFNSKLKKNQAKINREIVRHDKGDKSYYITANRTLNLAKNAAEIFKNSEVSKKRQLISFLLQNCKLEGKRLNLNLKHRLIRCLKQKRVPQWVPIRSRTQKRRILRGKIN